MAKDKKKGIGSSRQTLATKVKPTRVRRLKSVSARSTDFMQGLSKKDSARLLKSLSQPRKPVSSRMQTALAIYRSIAKSS